MNNNRRKEIRRIAALIDQARANFDEIREALEAVKDEESEAYENMPESLQQSDRGEKAQEAISSLEIAEKFDALAKNAIKQANSLNGEARIRYFVQAYTWEEAANILRATTLTEE